MSNSSGSVRVSNAFISGVLMTGAVGVAVAGGLTTHYKGEINRYRDQLKNAPLVPCAEVASGRAIAGGTLTLSSGRQLKIPSGWCLGR